MRDILIDAFLDSYPILPILFLTYFVFEYVERHNHLEKINRLLSMKGIGPFIGAAAGLLPQCGFSIAAAGLYLSNTISIGTLISVFIATSDEALPILISYPDQFSALMFIVFGKFVIAFLAGCLIDLVWHKKQKAQPGVYESREDHEHMIIAAAYRTLKIFIFILITNFFIGGIIHLLGTDRLSVVLMTDTYWQPLLAGIFGFIPNCAASVVLTQLFVNGSISFGSFAAGLITNAGLGLLVVARSRDDRKDLLLIASYMLLVAFICGVFLQWLL